MSDRNNTESFLFLDNECSECGDIISQDEKSYIDEYTGDIYCKSCYSEIEKEEQGKEIIVNDENYFITSIV